MKLSKLFIVIYFLVFFFFCYGIGFAEEGKKFDYSKSNLASFGVPDWNGFEPFKKFSLDGIDEIPGKETEVSKYIIDNHLLVISTYNDSVYNIGFDKDKKKPLDLALTDFEGDGIFKKVGKNEKFIIPKWIFNN